VYLYNIKVILHKRLSDMLEDQASITTGTEAISQKEQPELKQTVLTIKPVNLNSVVLY
jgi:hypothetical protein